VAPERLHSARSVAVEVREEAWASVFFTKYVTMTVT
jgi:hypothetical protein